MKILNLANFFVANAPMKKKSNFFVLPSQAGLPQDILSKRQKAREGGAYSAPPPGPPCFEGLKDDHTLLAQRALWFIQSYTTSSSIHK